MLSRYLLRSSEIAYYRDFFTVSGNWVCPPGVTKVSVLIMSSGLKGETATSNKASGTGAGGKGGFYYYINNYIVIPGQSYPIAVGAVCTSTTVRNTSDFNNLVANNNMSIFTSCNTEGGSSGGKAQQNNIGVGGVKANALKIPISIRNTAGECVSDDLLFALVNEVCYGGAAGDYGNVNWGTYLGRTNGGEGFNTSILDLKFNTNAGFGCGGKGGDVFIRSDQNGYIENLREGQDGGQGLVTFLYSK